MEIIAEIIRESVSGGFWNFIGYWIMIGLIVGLPLNFILKLFNRLFRHWNIRIHGYPPPHCDADGDFKKEKKEDDTDT